MNVSIGACEKQDVSAQKPTEIRLRQRIATANDLFIHGHFDAFVSMRTARERKTLFESEEDKKKAFNEWKRFLEREKPTIEVLNVEIRGLKAIAKMKAGVQTEDRKRSHSIIYDLWIFENGDWFLDTSGRTSPEFFPS
jgi:hypothetical protein